MSWIPRAILLAGLAAYLATSLPHGTLVLCIGAGGHLAIEDSSASCCGENQGCASAEAGTRGSESLHSDSNEITCVHPCSRCLDLPLPPTIGHLGVKVERSAQLVRPELELLSPGFDVASATGAVSSLASTQPEPASASVLQHLRVMVLRC